MNPGSSCWGIGKLERQDKDISTECPKEQVIVLYIGAIESSVTWAPVGDSKEHASELFHLRARKLGQFVYHIPFLLGGGKHGRVGQSLSSSALHP